MLHRTKVLLAIIAAIFLVTSYWGCNRLKDDFNENKPPEVRFVNVPLDSSVFNYAPVVRWNGYDSDGQVDAFQYHDDSTQAAVNAYNADTTGEALMAYINALPASVWVTTYANSDTIYLRRAESDTITPHIFMIRCVDNLGTYSQVKWRTFFRTNNPPNRPTVKWALDVGLTEPHGYDTLYNVPDSLFWSDALTSTYGGISFLWQGTDPDSRSLNVIPLTFSYKLTNVTTGQDFPYAVLDDSNHVIGYQTGWSPWTQDAQVVYTAANALAVDPNYVLDGTYLFEVKVRDDGLTEASHSAFATFKAVSALPYNDLLPGRQHNFERQLLLIDWNVHPDAVERSFGATDDGPIIAFYDSVVHEGLRLAESYRQLAPEFYPQPIPDEFEWLQDKNFRNGRPRWYDYIRHFKWVWIIDDNPTRNPADVLAVQERVKVLQDYMKVGGQVFMSGRSLLRTLGITGCPKDLDPAVPAERYLRDYFNLSSICAKVRYSAVDNIADFGGATTTERILSGLEIDSAKVHNLVFASQHLWCLPEVDFFGRSGGATGEEYTISLYNYSSCSANGSYNADSIDCNVDSAATTPSRAYLYPATGHTRILNVSRVYNLTKGVEGEFMYVDREQLSNGTLGNWRIVVSTPAEYGAWTNSDQLAVYYTFVPIQPSHDQPVVSDYIRYQSIATYDRFTGNYQVLLYTRFRSGICTFPLYMVKNDYVPELQATKVGQFVAYQAMFFNQLQVFRTNIGGGNGRPNP